MKKCSEVKQALHAGCSKAEQKKIAPLQTPFPGVQVSQNLISWRWSLPLSTNPVWWRSMHAISSYRSNRHTNRQGRLQYTAPQISVQCNNTSIEWNGIKAGKSQIRQRASNTGMKQVYIEYACQQRWRFWKNEPHVPKSRRTPFPRRMS